MDDARGAVDERRMIDLEAVPADGTLLVTLSPVDGVDLGDAGDVGEDGETVEAFLIALEDGVACYRNHCQHWTDVRLDSGDGAFVRNGDIFCQKHGATFQRETGYCDFGPCEGAVLDSVAVETRDGGVHLTDPDYVFVGVGPVERGDAEGGSRIDFTGS
ncbi:Rieske (2Fe-2S) protein [Halopenitus salinus]|jgi:nitrite reductase/ring-hydroxylating ferredoxin subunit|uniref:Rieske (2Fe-2S) protein n=1 Tax=Halopenitus salinus TaxID=1198295 RepID=A0ABD5UNV3_9EURY